MEQNWLRLLEALDFIGTVHQIIHGDISPNIIFIDELGHAHLGDLGHAQRIAGVEWPQPCIYGYGSQGFQSPEQRGRKTYGAPTCAFSLAATMSVTSRRHD